MKSRFKTNISSHKGKYLHKNQQGMSLLEVVVAMLLCGIGLAITVGMYQASIRHAQQAEYRAIAMREAQVLIDEMRANKLGAPGFVGVLNVNNGAAQQEANIEAFDNYICKQKDDKDECAQLIKDVSIKKGRPKAEQWRNKLVDNIPTIAGHNDWINLEWAGKDHKDRYTLTIRWKTVIDETASQGKGSATTGTGASSAPDDDAVVVQFVL